MLGRRKRGFKREAAVQEKRESRGRTSAATENKAKNAHFPRGFTLQRSDQFVQLADVQRGVRE
jgi:hypothetical protein